MALDVLVDRPDVRVLSDLADFSVELIGRYPAYRAAIMKCIAEFGESLDLMIAERNAQGERVTLKEVEILATFVREGLERVCRTQTESS